MKIHCVMVSSLNGKIDQGQLADAHTWVSPEDIDLFTKLKSFYTLIVMGRKTFEVKRDVIKLSPGILRIVMTHTPLTYKSDHVTGQLEFTNLSPKKLVDELEGRGYSKMLLAGGGEINKLFFEENLIDELHVTIEPLLTGMGTNIMAESLSNIKLQLIDMTKLNRRGTYHAIYKVAR